MQEDAGKTNLNQNVQNDDRHTHDSVSTCTLVCSRAGGSPASPHKQFVEQVPLTHSTTGILLHPRPIHHASANESFLHRNVQTRERRFCCWSACWLRAFLVCCCFGRRLLAPAAPSAAPTGGRLARRGRQSAHVHCLSTSFAERPAHVAWAVQPHRQQVMLDPKSGCMQSAQPEDDAAVGGAAGAAGRWGGTWAVDVMSGAEEAAAAAAAVSKLANSSSSKSIGIGPGGGGGCWKAGGGGTAVSAE